MKTLDTYRLIIFTLCGMAFWGTAAIASAEEEYSGDIIKLWPKDVARQDNEGMGTPKPDRGDGHIRLTDVIQPSFPCQKDFGRSSPYWRYGYKNSPLVH